MYVYKPVSVAESADASSPLTLKKLLLFRLNNPATQIYLHILMSRYLSVAENLAQDASGLDANTLYKTAFFSYANVNGGFNLPFYYGFLMVIQSKGPYPTIQISFSRIAYENSKVAYRTCDSGRNWNDWISI